MTRARILSGILPALLALGLGGCGAFAPHPLLPGVVSEADRGLALTIRPAYQLQTVHHRWVAGDIHQYDVVLRVWNGEAFVELSPAATVVLPQKGTDTKSRAVFTNLKQGVRYQATVLAKGNAGGSAPEHVLNAQAPARFTFDFTSSQDVASTLAHEVLVTLDAVPFSGTFTLAPANPPAGTDGYEAHLEDADIGATYYVGTYAATETMVLRNLRTGIAYRVRLSALADGISVQQATSAPYFFDPQGQELEGDLTIPITFQGP
jgi:hypothetical protein